jgi:hypothetical protein
VKQVDSLDNDVAAEGLVQADLLEKVCPASARDHGSWASNSQVVRPRTIIMPEKPWVTMTTRPAKVRFYLVSTRASDRAVAPDTCTT